MENKALNVIEEVLLFIKNIKENYKKSKCTAREIEIMLYLYKNNKSNKTLKAISSELKIVESVVSKYIKNLSLADLIDKESRTSTEKLNQLLKEINDIDIKYNFISKMRKVYDEKMCTLSEIEILLFITYNPKSTVTDIYKRLKIPQSSVSKLVQKMCDLGFIEKKDRTFISSQKLLTFIDYAIFKK